MHIMLYSCCSCPPVGDLLHAFISAMVTTWLYYYINKHCTCTDINIVTQMTSKYINTADFLQLPVLWRCYNWGYCSTLLLHLAFTILLNHDDPKDEQANDSKDHDGSHDEEDLVLDNPVIEIDNKLMWYFMSLLVWIASTRMYLWPSHPN